MEAKSVNRPSFIVKQEEVLDDIAPASSTIPPSAATEAMSVVLDEIKSVFFVHDVDF